MQTVEVYASNLHIWLIAEQVVAMVKKIMSYCSCEQLQLVTARYEQLQMKTQEYHHFTLVIIPSIKFFIKQLEKISSALLAGSPEIELTVYYYRSGKYHEEFALIETDSLIKLQEVAPNWVHKRASKSQHFTH